MQNRQYAYTISKLDKWQLLSAFIATLATHLANVYLFTDGVCATPTYGFVYVLCSRISINLLPSLHQNPMGDAPKFGTIL